MLVKAVTLAARPVTIVLVPYKCRTIGNRAWTFSFTLVAFAILGGIGGIFSGHSDVYVRLELIYVC